MAINQVVNQFQQQMHLLVRQISAFFSFVFNRIKNFSRLALAEQTSYGLIGVGLILIITSVILFIL
ncbi:MAG TPA: hypothetical protein VJA18_03620 [Candidatus Nanoarchaeia archaeon]|nr:hypothetical protein [Candidatus Nanoarchaeia archaeon]